MKKTALVAAIVLASCAHASAAPRPRATWTWAAPSPAYVGMPASGRVVTYGHSVLVRLDDGGHVRWHAPLVGLRDVAPLVTDTDVIAATDDGVAAFRADDGSPTWRAAVGDRASTPVLAGGRPVVTTWDGRVVALGDGGWTASLDGDSLGPPASANGVVVASWDSGVAAFDAVSGAPKWRHAFDGDGTSAPAAANGVAIVVAPDFKIHAFDLDTGRPRWSVDTPGAGAPEAPPVTRGDEVAAADRDGNLSVVNVRTGRRLWSARVDAAVDRAGPVFVGERVALPLDDGRLLVAWPHGHRLLRFGGPVSGIAATSSHTVLIATREADPSTLAEIAIR